MSAGWIKLHRQILDSRLWSGPDSVLKVAIYLLLSCNHEQKFYRMISIKRGQCIRSAVQISEACGMSRKVVRRALDILEKDGFLKKSYPFGSKQVSMLSICKYGTYQGEREKEGQGGSQGGTHQRAKEVPTNKKVITKKNENKEHPLFNEFWKVYPNKTGKAKAETAFIKALKKTTDEIIMSAVKLNAISNQQWLKDNGQFIPMPATWLNQERWDDEIQTNEKPQAQTFTGNPPPYMGEDR